MCSRLYCNYYSGGHYLWGHYKPRKRPLPNGEVGNGRFACQGVSGENGKVLFVVYLIQRGNGARNIFTGAFFMSGIHRVSQINAIPL